MPDSGADILRHEDTSAGILSENTTPVKPDLTTGVYVCVSVCGGGLVVPMVPGEWGALGGVVSQHTACYMEAFDYHNITLTQFHKYVSSDPKSKEGYSVMLFLLFLYIIFIIQCIELLALVCRAILVEFQLTSYFSFQ